MSWLRALGELLSGRFGRARPGRDPEQLAARALATLEHALAESDAESRLQGLRDALAMAERVDDPRGDQLVLEASLHLGERLRAAGQRDQAVLHFEQAMLRSFRVADPLGRHKQSWSFLELVEEMAP